MKRMLLTFVCVVGDRMEHLLSRMAFATGGRNERIYYSCRGLTPTMPRPCMYVVMPVLMLRERPHRIGKEGRARILWPRRAQQADSRAASPKR